MFPDCAGDLSYGLQPPSHSVEAFSRSEIGNALLDTENTFDPAAFQQIQSSENIFLLRLLCRSGFHCKVAITDHGIQARFLQAPHLLFQIAVERGKCTDRHKGFPVDDEPSIPVDQGGVFRDLAVRDPHPETFACNDLFSFSVEKFDLETGFSR